ncbi:lipopolysaccharide biosynthesis protein RfbH [Pseudomonadales bacterium]|nr:lipopolysaccharide biosynthesis protein RfbH [Pseudomonadales bacterium]MDA8949871.1 lipopolysaccharide biosynthesis protein RfbH [Pseudomonadales bacterium]
MNKEQLRAEISELVAKYAQLEFAEKIFVGGETVIPPSGKKLGVKELQNMVDASLDAWLTTGRFNAAFEKKLADFIGVDHLITVNSGSSANLVAFSTLTSPRLGDRAIKKGDEVIGVAAGFPTTVNPIVQFGAVPVFVDVEMDTHNINADLIEAAITTKTKAIMLAHTLGNPFNCEKVKAICKKYNLWLIEDCCDALGATFDGKMVGTWGDIATLSFYPAHHMTMGEGGAVFMSDPLLKLIAESFRDWGRDCYCAPGQDDTCGKRFGQQFGSLPDGYDHKYVYSHLGYNLKITDMQAACGLAQLDSLEGFIAKRRANFQYLSGRLSSLLEFVEIAQPTENSNPSWFGFPITIKESAGIKRVDLVKYLDQYKIGSRLLFAGNLTNQPYFQGAEYRVSGSLENTDRTMNQTFWLGVQPTLGEEHYNFVAEKMEEFFGVNF